MNKHSKSECKFIRTKSAYINNVENPEAWRTNDSSTRQYWCVKTMGVIGPDNNLAEPETCQPDRKCFLPEF